MMEDVAQIEHAMPLSALTKTDYALRPRVGARANMATLAPFGDVYLTSLEWLARARNRISAVLPEELLGLNAVAGDMATVLRDAVCQLGADGDIADRALSSLLALDPLRSTVRSRHMSTATLSWTICRCLQAIRSRRPSY